MDVRWLGVAGIELHAGTQTLLIDPFVTRFPLWRMWIGRIRPDRERIAELIPNADVILVTHTHWDHALDAPTIARRTGATVFGSSNTCRLLTACQVPEPQIQVIRAGDGLALGAFQVRVLPAIHPTLFGQEVLPGEMPVDLEPPLRARAYRMDAVFSFLIRAERRRLLIWSSAQAASACPADVLFVKPYQTRECHEALLGRVQPQLVIPIHWDDFFRPLSKPVRPMIAPPRWQLPPLKRVDLPRFEQLIEQLAPQTHVLVPERFRSYALNDRCRANAFAFVGQD